MCDIRQTILELKKMNTDIEEINERSSNDTQAQSHLHHSVLYPALLRQGIDHPTNVLPDPTSLKDPNAILTAMKMCQIIYYSQYNQLMQALRNRQMQRQRQKEQVDNHENKYRYVHKKQTENYMCEERRSPTSEIRIRVIGANCRAKDIPMLLHNIQNQRRKSVYVKRLGAAPSASHCKRSTGHCELPCCRRQRAPPVVCIDLQ